MSDPSVCAAEHDRRIAQGAGVNALGMLGKAAMPAFFILVTRLYGPEVMGLYYLATRIVEAAFNLTVSGFNDGVLMFASRDVDHGDREDRLYQMLASGVVFSVGVAAVLIVLAITVGPELVSRYSDWVELPWVVAWLALALPFLAIPVLAVAATKALQIMRWDALLYGALQPLGLVTLAVLSWLLGFGLEGLLWSYLLTQVAMTALGVWVFSRYFDLRRLGRAILRFRPYGPLLGFAVPQNLNMTFNRLVTDLDVLMLTYFGFGQADVAFYGMGAQVVRNVRQIKLAFSGSYAPVIARYHAEGRTRDMNASFSMVSRWTTTLALPTVALVVLLRGDLLRLFHSDFTGDNTFMLLLTVPPLLACTVGLAGNIVVMTGHPRWNLFNSLVVGGANFALNALLIPWLGLVGAALGTTLASLLVAGMQLLEVRLLVGVKLLLREVWKPYAAALPALLGVVAALVLGSDDHLALRVGAAVAVPAVYVATLVALGLAPRDTELFAFWRKKSR